MMNEHEKTHDEKKDAEAVREKYPYHTPTLKKLGSVEQITQGTHVANVPDVGGTSF